MDACHLHYLKEVSTVLVKLNVDRHGVEGLDEA